MSRRKRRDMNARPFEKLAVFPEQMIPFDPEPPERVTSAGVDRGGTRCVYLTVSSANKAHTYYDQRNR
ncbi:MAG: hypothetical protein AAF580_06975 [Pseudomonadota bacterium]